MRLRAVSVGRATVTQTKRQPKSQVSHVVTEVRIKTKGWLPVEARAETTWFSIPLPPFPAAATALLLLNGLPLPILLPM